MDGIGSVIGLADGSGASAANFHYDSFGNLRGATGTKTAVSEAAGGDFRFQGQWLEANTDLYHFRARYYDPETGRFVSRDPVDIIEREPESSNLYQFAYHNPRVYGDPTGLFTLVQLQAGLRTQDALNSVQLHITNFVRQYLIDKAKGVATDIITGVAKNIFANLASLDPTLSQFVSGESGKINVNQLGGQWEKLIRGEFKKFIGQFLPDYLNSIWFEPEISSNGNPISDGINIGQFSANLRLKNARHPNPDFLIKKDGGPASTDFAKGKGDKSYLIGDIKWSWSRVEKDSKKAQFQAIVNYASFSNRHQVVPIAFYITMIGGKTTLDLHKVSQKAFSKGVYPQYLTLFPGITGTNPQK
ncbi:MAG: RHS repeat-associated core domain-containing protein [Prochloron sp. SP5CPC1]|nr:RHS repeat-associated core domain-containing protein [Candidatus Paraprochloron terpiosi SP5CPC1]